MHVELRHLRYFVAVADESHFSRAAERLHVSQPALSQQIRDLERSLGAKLFVRHPRGANLTGEGEELLAGAREVLREVDATLERVRRIARGEAGVLRVGFLDPGAARATRVLLREFQSSHQDVRIELRQFGWDRPDVGLATSSVDVGLVRLPLPPRSPLSVLPIASEPRVVAMAADHRLACRAGVRLDELEDEPFFEPPATSQSFRDFWLARDERTAGSEVRIAGEFSLPEEWLENIAAARGVGLCPASAREHYRHRGVAFVPIEALGPSEVAIAWRRDDSSALVLQFARLTAQALRSPRLREQIALSRA